MAAASLKISRELLIAAGFTQGAVGLRPPAHIEPQEHTAWQFREAATRWFVKGLDPIEGAPRSSEDLEQDAALGACAAPLVGSPLTFTPDQASTFARQVRAEAARRVKRATVAGNGKSHGIAQESRGLGPEAEMLTESALPSGALRSLATYEVVSPTYLWTPYIPEGALTLLVGDYGTGKTWLALAIAAAGSRGWHLPDHSDGRIPEGHVECWRTLYLTAENDPETLRFRIDRLGGDPAQLVVWDTAAGPLPSLGNLAQLDEALTEVKPRLVVVDPIQSALGAQVDMNRSNEVRPLLDGLVGLARKHSCALMAAMHLNKSSSLQARHRVMGSVDFAATARSILLAGSLPGDRQSRVVVHLKCSLAEEGSSLGFALDSGGSDVDFGWTGTVDIDADELLAAEPRSERTDTQVDAAVAALRDILAQGPKTKAFVAEAAQKRGISETTLKRAARRLRVRYGSVGFPRTTTWELPPGGNI